MMTEHMPKKKYFTDASDPIEDVLKLTAIALEKQAQNVQILDLRENGAFTDFFLVATGSSSRQLQAIAQAIDEVLPKGALLSIEGVQEGRWIVIDAGHVVCHLFLEGLRSYYHLEQLWHNAPKLPIPASFYGAGASPMDKDKV